MGFQAFGGFVVNWALQKKARLCDFQLAAFRTNMLYFPKGTILWRTENHEHNPNIETESFLHLGVVWMI